MSDDKIIRFDTSEYDKNFILNWIEENKPKNPVYRIPNKERIIEVIGCFEEIKGAVTGEDLIIKDNRDDFKHGLGYIKITAKKIIVSDVERFLKVIRKSCVVDQVPKVDGSAEIGISFDGLFEYREVGK